MTFLDMLDAVIYHGGPIIAHVFYLESDFGLKLMCFTQLEMDLLHDLMGFWV